MNQVFPIIPAPARTLWALGIFALLMAVLLGISGYIAYSCRHVQFELSATELHIRGDIYGRRIPLSSLEIDRAKKVNLAKEKSYRPKWKTNGIGLPGYASGWFKLNNGEKGLLFVTYSKKLVYLPTTEGYVLLMSVQEPEQFLEYLQKNTPDDAS